MNGSVLKIQNSVVATYPCASAWKPIRTNAAALCSGAMTTTGREIVDLLPLENRRNDSPRNRFEVTPDDVRLAEKTAREENRL